MKAIAHIPKLVLLVFAAFFVLNTSAGEIPLKLTHRIIGAEQRADGGTALALELTARNEGLDPLSGVRLLLMPGIPFLAGNEAPLALGDLAVDESVSTQWTITALGTVDSGWPLFERLRFGAEAGNGAGELLTFPADSQEEQP